MLRKRTSKASTGQAASLDNLRPLSRRQRWARVGLVFIAVAALCAYLDAYKVLQYVEYYAAKPRTDILSKQGSDKEAQSPNLEYWARQQITILVISDPAFRPKGTFAKIGAPPLPRSYHARLIRELTRCGAKVIAFDLVFDLPSPDDKELAAAAREHGRVIWGAAYADELKPESLAFEPNPTLRDATLPTRAHLGHLLVPQNAELPEIDRIRPFVQRPQMSVGAFSVQAALSSLGLEKELPYKVGNAWQIGRYRIPIDEAGYFKFSYFGKPLPLENPDDVPEGSFLVRPYELFFSGMPVSEHPVDRKHFLNKIVLIGDTTKVGNDHRLTPLGDMWGIEIHAHAIASLLRGLQGQAAFVRQAPLAAHVALIAVLTALACLVAGFARIGWAALFSCTLLAFYFFINAWVLTAWHWDFRLVSPMLAVVLASAILLLERGLTEEKEKNRARGLLGRYVSPQIAAYILANPEKCVLGGERVEATVLFSDIRGFTAMSEKLAPEEVVGRLNEYLQVMTDQVFDNEGAVDKYVGDAIMALFGVPIPHPDHARRAVATAIAMQERLLELQAKWKSEGLAAIDIGVGINTGEMVVGNIGARDRLDFTVIGDSVNLASRVESLNKEVGSRILITRAVYDRIGAELETRGPILAAVKGKEESVEVFEVYGWKNASS